MLFETVILKMEIMLVMKYPLFATVF